MKYTIGKEFEFCASHRLDGLPETHPCSRLHGHNYKVTFEFASNTLNDIGFVIDYRDLDGIKNQIDLTLDHRHLNDVFDFNPTAEKIAEWFFIHFNARFPQLQAVTVKETDKTYARYTFENR